MKILDGSLTLLIEGEEVEADLVGELSDGRPISIDIEQRAAAAAQSAASELLNTPLEVGADGRILPGQGVEGGIDWSSGTDWSSIKIEGHTVPGRFTPGCLKAEFLFESPGPWKQYQELVEAIEKQVYRSVLGHPTAMYREEAGTLFQRVVHGGSASIAIANLRLKNLKMWVPVGTTIPGPRNNRLRKFVQRAGQLVEVRARGRTGYRSLEDAVLAALKPKL